MDARKLKAAARCVVFAFLIALLPAAPAALAQSVLPLGTPVEGEIALGTTNQWTFNAISGSVLSFVVEADPAGDLDPAILLTDSSGRAVLSSDDYNYPDSLDPLLEAVTMPRTDLYTLTVSGYNNTGGDYQLTMLPGYGVPASSDDFTTTQWQATGSTLTAQRSNGALSLSRSGGEPAAAFSSASDTFSDFYAQAQVSSISGGSSGWIVGMAFRRQGDMYYLLSINSGGSWRFSLVQDGAERVIHDWTPHPGIRPGETSFSLGVMAAGEGYDFFYNTGYIGAEDDATLTEAGQIGLTVSAPQGQPSSATFDDLVVTTPVLIDGAFVVPQEIQVGDSVQMVQALRRLHLISASGQIALNLPESSVEYARPGINRFMFARGVQYTNFAIGATVNLSGASPGSAGCGLVFRFTGEQDYTLAYIDQTGEYGVSKRTGDTFSPGIYGDNDRLGAGTHQLLVIADENALYYYIDRQFVGSLENTMQAGEVGIAVVNFEGNSTACHYTNFWLWQWK
jgi:hypothetical protein